MHHESITYQVKEALRKEEIELKSKKKGNLIISSTNLVYEKEKYEKIISAIKKALKSNVGPEGEIIELTLSTGEILDMGKPEFKILRGKVFEVYSFKHNSSAIIRITVETDLQSGKKWVSIDVDEQSPSLWFEE